MYLDPKLQLLTNTLRLLAVDAIEKAGSGHPGLPLGAAPMAAVLWARHLKITAQQPTWVNRDRFVLSAGHGSALLYALLHVFGFAVDQKDLSQFRQLHSRTAGHPEFDPSCGIEATTGPLGQGAANAVGMAMAERYLASLFNTPEYPLIDHMTYALVSDGDLMEGISYEATALAGHLQLGKLVYLYDANNITLDGPKDLTWSEDISARFCANGWHVQTVVDGNHDLNAIDQALQQARAYSQAPSLIIINTTIGFGAPDKQGTSQAHGSPLGASEVAALQQALGLVPPTPFFVPPALTTWLKPLLTTQQAAYQHWQTLFTQAQAAYPELLAKWEQVHTASIQIPWPELLAACDHHEAIASRKSAGRGLQVLAKHCPQLLVGDADLSSSTMTGIKESSSHSSNHPQGRNIHFGVREHAMAAIANGMAYHGGIRPVVATFFVFSDYLRPALRLAALANLPVIYIFTHDSIGLGEDGPTHQPIEHLASLRAIPQLELWRPANGLETACALAAAVQRTSGPTALILSRQKITPLPKPAVINLPSQAAIVRGGYIVWQNELPLKLLLIATGSEVALALATAKVLATDAIGVRVISLPSWEVFARQTLSYRQHILPPQVSLRLSIEAGSSLGWERYVGDHGLIIAIDRFGASAPAENLWEYFGFTVSAIAQRAQAMLQAKLPNSASA